MPSQKEKMEAVKDILEQLKEIIEDSFHADDPEHINRPAMDLIKDAIEIYEKFEMGGDR